jgi:hypothetical protein
MKHLHTFESFLFEAVRVDTTPYRIVHTKEPKGHGLWFFSYRKDGDDTFAVPQSMNYGDAVKWAKDQAKKEGKDSIFVMG